MSTYLNISDKIKLESLPTPLLLNFYPGAAAAYSLRKLDGAYSGDAITVRRASDNTTQNIGFVNNELDTASLETFCSGTDGFVTTWYDQSGNGNNMTQTTADKQPLIVSSGSTITEGTKPSMDFQTDFMDGSTGYSFTDFAAFSVIHNDGNQGFPITCQSNNSYGWRQHINGVNSFRSRMFDTNIDTSNTPTQNYTLLSSLSYGNNGYIFVNGVQEATASITPAADTSATLQIARGTAVAPTTPYDGRIQEVVIYDSDQSSNISGIHTNINDFYSIY